MLSTSCVVESGAGFLTFLLTGVQDEMLLIVFGFHYTAYRSIVLPAYIYISFQKPTTSQLVCLKEPNLLKSVIASRGRS